MRNLQFLNLRYFMTDNEKLLQEGYLGMQLGQVRIKYSKQGLQAGAGIWIPSALHCSSAT